MWWGWKEDVGGEGGIGGSGSLGKMGRGMGDADAPKKSQADINKEISAAAGDEEDAQGWDCQRRVSYQYSAIVLVNQSGREVAY